MSQLHRISPDIEDPKADVVFVHGLGGDAFTTWQIDDEPESCWARWLAADLPDVAVHSCAYNASKIAWFDRPLPLVQQGDGLLLGLLGARLGVRPLVFVGHSMGGLVVKQMLRKLHDKDIPEWRSLRTQSTAVVFFGTPHRGADLADFLFRLSKYLGASASARDLQTHNGLLANLNEWFGERAASREIVAHCLYETQPTKVVGMVVEQDSGDIGIPGVPSFPVEADHIGICKFANRDDHRFGYVVDVVRRASEAVKIARHSRGISVADDPNPDLEITSSGGVVMIRIPRQRQDITIGVALGPSAEDQSALFAGDRNRTIRIAGARHVVTVGEAAVHLDPAPTEPDQTAFTNSLPTPADLDDFHGRVEQVTELIDTLRGSGQIAIRGMGGIGKTALAVHVARLLDAQGETPDGQRYLDLQGVSDKPLAPVEAIGRLIQSFDPTARAPVEAEAAARTLRQMLGGQRVLLLLDDAKDGHQIQWLLDARTRASSAKILVTSRQTVIGDGLASIQLDLMAPAEARTFLRQLLGNRTVTDEELDQLAMRCGHLPLALRVAGRFLQEHETWSIEEYLDALASAEVKL